MQINKNRETCLLFPENLPLDVGELGIVTEAGLIMPGVYDTVLEIPETALAIEAFIVLKNAAEISEFAKGYGRSAPGHPELLIYSENKNGNTRYIIDYELIRYKMLHGLPLPENENIRSIAAIGAEMYPRYFGGYPIPYRTPWGYTTRNKIIANGLYWLETEQCQRGLAVAYPKYDDLSDGARGLAEPFDDGSAHTNNQMPGYLFFRDTDSCIPLFELVFASNGPDVYSIDRAALMNAVYQFHPEYATQYNVAEQAGMNDGLGQFFRMLGVDVEPQSSPERIISLTAQAGTRFIDF